MKKTCTIKEAIAEVNKKRGLKHVKYAVFVRPFLPIDNTNQGFPGLCLVQVTKKHFIRAIEDSLRHFEDRGGRIELDIPESDCSCFSIG